MNEVERGLHLVITFNIALWESPSISMYVMGGGAEHSIGSVPIQGV